MNMRTILAAAAVLTLTVSGYAFAAGDTVAEALKASDDARVELDGEIVRHVYKEKYLFRDKTGSMIVDIDRDLHRGILPDGQKLRIRGEVDTDHGYDNEVEAKRIDLK